MSKKEKRRQKDAQNLENELKMLIQSKNFNKQITNLINNKELRVRYIRNRQKQPIGCVVQMGDRFGWSLCHKSDLRKKFSHKIGRLLAAAKLLKRIKSFNIPHDIQKMIDWMKQGAQNK